MAYAKLTDGVVTRFFDLNNPRSKHQYNELKNNNTGYNEVIDRHTGQTKEFTEQQVKDQIDAARAASKKKERKTTVNLNRAVYDDDDTTPVALRNNTDFVE